MIPSLARTEHVTDWDLARRAADGERHAQELLFRRLKTAVHATLYRVLGSNRHMEDLLRHLDRWGVHPEVIVTDRFVLDDAAAAYRLADRGDAGKVVITFP